MRKLNLLLACLKKDIMTESENHFVYFAILSLLIRNTSCFHLCIAIGLKLYFLCILLWETFLILNAFTNTN